MRILLIQSAVFAVIFFLAALIIQRGQPFRLILVTLVATAIYAALTAALRATIHKK